MEIKRQARADGCSVACITAIHSFLYMSKPDDNYFVIAAHTLRSPFGFCCYLIRIFIAVYYKTLTNTNTAVIELSALNCTLVVW